MKKLLLIICLLLIGCQPPEVTVEQDNFCGWGTYLSINGHRFNHEYHGCIHIKIGLGMDKDANEIQGVIKETDLRESEEVVVIDLEILANNSPSTLDQKYTINDKLKNKFFKEHPDWFVVDKLNSILKISGEFKGTATGTTDGSSSTVGFLFTSFTQSSSRTEYEFKGNFNAVGITEQPLVWINETKFYKLVKRYDVKAVKCIYDYDPYSVIYDRFGESPTNLFCAFERETIQFLTTIDSINNLVYTCDKEIPITVYINNGMYTIPFEFKEADEDFKYCKKIRGTTTWKT